MNKITNFFKKIFGLAKYNKNKPSKKIIHDNVDFKELEEIDIQPKKTKKASKPKMKVIKDNEN